MGGEMQASAEPGSGPDDRETPEDRLAVASTFVLDGLQPLRMVVHHGDGTWTFCCGTTAEAAHFVTVHAGGMFRRYGYDLFHLRDLPAGHIAERNERGDEWLIAAYQED